MQEKANNLGFFFSRSYLLLLTTTTTKSGEKKTLISPAYTLLYFTLLYLNQPTASEKLIDWKTSRPLHVSSYLITP